LAHCRSIIEVDMDTTLDWADLSRTAVREATRLGLSHDDAEDAAQEAMLRAWRKRTQCRDAAAAAGWVATIGRREAYRVAGRRRELATEPPVVADAIVQTELSDLRIDLRAAMRALPPVDRMVLFLRYERDLGHVDIARIMGSPTATAAIRLHRAHKRLLQVVKSTYAHRFDGD